MIYVLLKKYKIDLFFNLWQKFADHMGTYTARVHIADTLTSHDRIFTAPASRFRVDDDSRIHDILRVSSVGHA